MCHCLPFNPFVQAGMFWTVVDGAGPFFLNQNSIKLSKDYFFSLTQSACMNTEKNPSALRYSSGKSATMQILFCYLGFLV